MKKLIGLLTILLAFVFTIQAQGLGDSKDDVLRERGTPDQVQKDQFIYVTDKAIVIQINFSQDAVVSYAVMKKINKDIYKKLAQQNIQDRGAPDGKGIKGNLFFLRWDYTNTYYFLGYDISNSVLIMLVTNKK